MLEKNYLHHQLMSSSNHLQIICVVELLSNVLPEGVASAPRVHPPSRTIIGVRPEEVAHWAFVGDFLEPFEGPDVVQGLDAGGESAMEAKELIFDDGCEGKVVKEFSEAFPDIGVAVLAAAFIVKAIDLGDLSGLVISPQDGDSVFVPHF